MESNCHARQCLEDVILRKTSLEVTPEIFKLLGKEPNIGNFVMNLQSTSYNTFNIKSLY